ncbi:MAG TPA: NAD(P)-dependent oxidoreductase [Bryobacteraceae bacterium]|nr:NAD(P)-dependent oxidoreductase [Bryobacteraceae bacterium]
MANLAFLGLGIMGYPMAQNLLRAGHRVALWSHTADKARKLAGEKGGVFCATPREAAEQADGVFLCVGTPDMSESVLTEDDGVIQSARPGTIVADCSTVSPVRSRRIAEQFAGRGVEFLDAPCTGSKSGAEGATLTFMIGGKRETFERAKPWFEAMGKLFYYCGESGQGLCAKLTQNLVLSNMMEAFNEGIVLATRAGVDPGLMVDILNNSAAKSGLVSGKAPAILARDFTTNFSTKWMAKDIGLALDLGREVEVPLPLTGVTQQMFRAAISKGYADEDMCSTVKVLEDLTGVTVKKSS